jgi:hypothetical protein
LVAEEDDDGNKARRADSESHDVPESTSYRPPVKPVLPAGMVDPGSAKQQILAAVEGDIEAARHIWGDRGSEPIAEADLAGLLASATYSEGPL